MGEPDTLCALLAVERVLSKKGGAVSSPTLTDKNLHEDDKTAHWGNR
jgi:hypothetical protein